jgi:hypothetical protein
LSNVLDVTSRQFAGLSRLLKVRDRHHTIAIPVASLLLMISEVLPEAGPGPPVISRLRAHVNLRKNYSMLQLLQGCPPFKTGRTVLK